MLQEPVPLDNVLNSPGFVVILAIAMLVAGWFMYRFIRGHPMMPFKKPPTGKPKRPAPPPPAPPPKRPRPPRDRPR
jgi:energy-coupling factor transporter transmembrane protein EcfT